MKKLFIEGKREGYAPDQCAKTMTIGQMKELFETLISKGFATTETEIYLQNDGGYTFGSIDTYYMVLAEDYNEHDIDDEVENFLY